MNSKIILLSTFAVLLLVSCGKSLDDGFEEANKNVKQKFLKQFVVDSPEQGYRNKTYTIGYDSNKRVSSISDDNEPHFFNYNNNGSLTSITGSKKPFLMSELYQAPYDLFEKGNVLSYDKKGNPDKIEIFETSNGQVRVLTGEISYDDAPNPFYYTMKAGGIIEVLDQVDLNFGQVSPSLVKAKRMLPFNNINSMIFKNTDGSVDCLFRTN